MEDIEQFPFEYTLSVINGKWKIRILYILSIDGTCRYGELMGKVKGITHKMLSKQLKELELDEIIRREEFAQIPLKVEYSLTPKGQFLIPLINEICKWGELNRPIIDGKVIKHKWHIG